MIVKPEQFFRAEHYAAFDPPKPDLDDDATQQERINVQEALLHLGGQLYPFIHSKKWDLHRHRQKQHYTSSWHFIFDEGKPIVNQIDSMWLHWGKSETQLDGLKTLGGFDYKSRDVEEFYNAFYLHTRIQIYINSCVVRCWLMLATDKNYYDRSEFLKRLRHSESFREEFWDAVQPITDREYFYEIDGVRFDITSNMDKDRLLKFVRSDRAGVYSGIVKEYGPNDPRISRANIVAEMQENLNLLYPIYDLMAYRMKVAASPKTPDLSKLFGGNVRVR